jgi:hypothetical protein
MTEYVTGTLNLSDRFKNADDLFNENADVATAQNLADYVRLKQDYRHQIDVNSTAMINVSRLPNLNSTEGLAALEATKDDCLNSLTEIVIEMEQLASDVSDDGDD